jgi:hypothetical protein
MQVYQSELTGSLLFKKGNQLQAALNPGDNTLSITGSLILSGSTLEVGGSDLVARVATLESGSGGDAAIGAIHLFTGSADGRLTRLEAKTGSIDAHATMIADLNAATSSYALRTQLANVYSSSVQISASGFLTSQSAAALGFGSGGSGVSSYRDLTNVPAGILSSSVQVQALGFVTSSVSSTGSLITTASATNNTITFTKGDASTFDITIATGSGDVVETATVTDTFTNVTTHDVTHNFNTRNVIVSVYDTAYNQLIPLTVNVSNVNSVRVTFSSATSGHVVVAKGGHIVSGSSSSETYKAVLNGSNTYSVTHGLAEDYPLVQVYDSSRAQVIPSSIVSNNNNQVTISFSANFNGNVIVKK